MSWQFVWMEQGVPVLDALSPRFERESKGWAFSGAGGENKEGKRKIPQSLARIQKKSHSPTFARARRQLEPSPRWSAFSLFSQLCLFLSIAHSFCASRELQPHDTVLFCAGLCPSRSASTAPLPAAQPASIQKARPASVHPAATGLST